MTEEPPVESVSAEKIEPQQETLFEIQPAHFGELTLPEHALAARLRDAQAKREPVTICSADGSAIKGLIVDVTENGELVDLKNGDDLYTFSVAHISLLKRPYREE